MNHRSLEWKESTAAWSLYVVPLALFALIASTRMNQSLWYDELWRTRLFLNERTLRDMLWGDVHNPLYNALMYVWINMAGDSEVAIRLPSLVCAMGVIALAVWWARRVVGSAAAWVAGLFLAVSPVMIWHGTEAKNTMLATLGAVWCVVGTERVARWSGERCGWWKHPAVWLAMGLIVAGWTSWNGLFAAGCGLLAMLTVWKRVPGRNWKLVLLAWGAALIALSPILIYKATRVATLMRAHPRHLDWREVVLFVTNWLPSGNALWPVQPYEETVQAFQPPHVWFTLGMAAVVMGLMVMGLRVLVQRGVAVWVARPMWIGLALMFVASAALDHWYGDRRWYIYQERNLLWMVVCMGVMFAAAVGQMAKAGADKKWQSGKVAEWQSGEEEGHQASGIRDQEEGTRHLARGMSGEKKWQGGKVAEWQSGEEEGHQASGIRDQGEEKCANQQIGKLSNETVQQGMRGSIWSFGHLGIWIFAGIVIALPLAGSVRMLTATREAWTVYKPNPDWRGAAGVIVADGGEGARVLEEETFQLDPLWYYRDGLRREVVPRGADLGAELWKRVGDGAVYVVSQQHRWPYRVERLERPGLQVKEIGRVSGVVVYRVGREEPQTAK